MLLIFNVDDFQKTLFGTDVCCWDWVLQSPGWENNCCWKLCVLDTSIICELSHPWQIVSYRWLKVAVLTWSKYSMFLPLVWHPILMRYNHIMWRKSAHFNVVINYNTVHILYLAVKLEYRRVGSEAPKKVLLVNNRLYLYFSPVKITVHTKGTVQIIISSISRRVHLVILFRVNPITYGGRADSAPPSGIRKFFQIPLNNYAPIVVDCS